tara:strand:+ start:448 stop:870 length:423 start_codon:yes stop_codon:yes gene_type:complete
MKYTKEDLFDQAMLDPRAIKMTMPNGYGVINNGVKIQKFPSKIELINLARSSNYYVECSEDEYKFFFKYGWKEGAIRLCISNTKRKLGMIEDKIKNEVSTRKNNKHIESLKAKRTGLLNKYALRKVELNKIKSNGKKECV